MTISNKYKLFFKGHILAFWFMLMAFINTFSILYENSTINLDINIGTGWLIIIILGIITLFCASIVLMVKNGGMEYPEKKLFTEIKQASVYIYILLLIIFNLIFRFIDWPFAQISAGTMAIIAASLLVLLCVSVVISVRSMEKE